MPLEAIPGTPAGIFVLRTMKAERLGRLLDEMVWDEDLIAKVPSEIFETVLRDAIVAVRDEDHLRFLLSAAIESPSLEAFAEGI